MKAASGKLIGVAARIWERLWGLPQFSERGANAPARLNEVDG